jgi:phenylalanyl-tRNA synthetase alpha chain
VHLLTAARREIEDIFLGLGFRVMEGPETELVYYNFDALNFDATHPSRQATDTFYISDDVLLRVHTSPMQPRAMEMQPPPLYVVIPGRTYRRDNDATHSPQFQQVEGLAVDEDITLGDLQGTLLGFARAYFGEDRRVRLRPHFFPFTEPSVECDVSCFNCNDGFMRDGSRCPLCKGEGWIEILGAGEVDPNVFEHVREHGYDPERHQGFAFGLGIERVAMLKHGVRDLRLFYDNDMRFLEQFG